VALRDPFTRWPVLDGMLPHRPRRDLPALPHLPGRAAPAARVSRPAGGRGAGPPLRRPSRGRRRRRRRGGRGAGRCMAHSPRLTRPHVPSTTMATIHTVRMPGSLARSRLPRGVGCTPRPWLPAEISSRRGARSASPPAEVAPRPAGGPTGRDAAARLPSRRPHHAPGWVVGGSGHHQPTGRWTTAHRGGRGQGPASPAAPRAGTLRPRADRPVACWTGCHLDACAVKGRCALMSARSALRAVP
jgi:hypothetical protein